MRPTWAEVSLEALRTNYRLISRHVSREIAVMAVVKADAYGHGAVQSAKALASTGARWFGVTSVEEGVQLRQGGVKGRIVALSGFWPGEEAALVEHEITPTVWEPRQLPLLAAAARRTRKDFKPLALHLKVDTGMARLGVSLRDLEIVLRSLKPSDPLFIEGALTHLASAEIMDAPDCEAQIQCFEAALRRITAAGIKLAWIHMANTAAIMTRNQTWKNMVRPGIALYGYALPVAAQNGSAPEAAKFDLQPALAWKTRILALRDVPAGQPISYDATYVTPAQARIAVLPVGYADGFSRQLSNKGRVLVRGQFAPVVGKVTMDLTMVDVTAVDGVEVGDEVTLIGGSGELKITAWDHAFIANTIPYEILCNISKRVPRKYVE
ncbi:MAG: alanine racemase [Acidobacteriales bacterium]|nr:alanine racemase [Terriglobales bacterium]